MVVWKHSTIIKADEAIKVVETGAYLLNHGTWWKRASFGEKETKNLFDTKSLDLESGDSMVYKKNWRSEPWTRSGWNFWYVKAVNSEGDTIMGYDLLYTAGTMASGTQVLPLISPNSDVEWTGHAGDSDYALTGNFERLSGRVAFNQGTISDLSIELDMNSMSHEIPGLISHLKSKDFFHVKKYPTAIFTASSATSLVDGSWTIEGELCLHGECQQEVWTATVIDSDTSVILNFNAQIDRTKYTVNYASSVKPDKEYSISDTIELSGSFFFRKDYPGSNPWNSIKAKD
jgi:polyisoprenoid-binding protein YceI